MPPKVQEKKGISFVGISVILILVIIVIFLVLFTSVKGLLFGGTDGYQAVFLTNGQVYFGQVVNPNTRYVEVSDIYYLQLQQPLQDQKAGETEAQPQLTLIKLGNELHGPEDSMQINRDHILFFEKLKVDSKVVKAIEEYKLTK